MAIDSEDKRRNVQGYGGAFAVIAPRADGGLDEYDRRHVGGVYRGPLIPLAVWLFRAPVGAAVRFLVGDTNGRVLTEIRPDLHRVSWRWNGMGEISFTMALTDRKLIPEYFVEGNRVLLSFDNGLPDWGGVLTGAREWSGSGVTFDAYSGEWLLAQRRTPRSRYFTNTQAGAILAALVAEANVAYSAGLKAGDIWPGGAGFSPEYNFRSLYDVADSLVGDMGAGAFDVTPALEGGVIVFYVNLYERKGSDKPGIALVEGRNIGSVRYREIDEAVNVWHMAGEGEGWGDTSRVYSMAINAESVARHGMREGFELQSGVVEKSPLDEMASKRLEETAWPARVLGLSVASASPGRFGDYGVGDAVSCRLYSYGFGGVDGLFEVRAREFFPDDGMCDLVLLEVR